MPFEEPEGRPGLVAKVVMGNVAVGGVSAALQAWMHGTNIPKAFVGGALGGAVHVSGKMISMGKGTASPISGMLLSSVGASMVGNASRGRQPFDELCVPIGFLRLRIAPHDTSRTRLSVNLFDVVMLSSLLGHKELDVNWQSSARAGTLVFNTSDRIINDGQQPDGVTIANMFVQSTAFASDQEEIRRHEYVHVQQYLFVQEVWGRPMDDFVRRRRWFLRVPKWVELGLGQPVFATLDYRLLRRPGPLRRSTEEEAYALSR